MITMLFSFWYGKDVFHMGVLSPASGRKGGGSESPSCTCCFSSARIAHQSGSFCLPSLSLLLGFPLSRLPIFHCVAAPSSTEPSLLWGIDVVSIFWFQIVLQSGRLIHKLSTVVQTRVPTLRNHLEPCDLGGDIESLGASVAPTYAVVRIKWEVCWALCRVLSHNNTPDVM